MRVLLPPSEAKNPGGTGPAVGSRPALTHLALAAPRATLLRELRRAVTEDPDAAAAGLKLPPARAEAALAANRVAATSPTLPALLRYAGVIVGALDPASLPPAAYARAGQATLFFSGLWGVVGGTDPVPDYRVPASGTLPWIGGIAAYWRDHLWQVVPALLGDEPVVDLRSTDYRSLWRVPRSMRDQVVTVRVLARRADGRVAPVSHHAKTVKGRLVRALVTDRHRPASDALVALDRACAALGIDLVDTSTATARSVDVVAPIEWTVVQSRR